MKLFSAAQAMFLIALSVALVSISFFSVINGNFKTVPSMLSFLQKAHVYENISNIVRLEIQNNYPPIISKNVLVTGVVNRAVEFIVTPQLVEKIAAPALYASVEFTKAPTAIIDDKVVVTTALYKTQVKELLSDFGLPGLLVVNLNYVVDSLPSQLTIVDLKKNPNNVLGLLIKARTLFEQNRTLLIVSWIVIILSVFFLIILNLHQVKKIVKGLFVAFAVSGAAILVFSFVFPWVLSLALPTTQSALGLSQNKLITDALQVLVNEIRNIGMGYVVVSVICFIVLKMVNFNKTQKYIDRKLKRVHVPQITVEVK